MPRHPTTKGGRRSRGGAKHSRLHSPSFLGPTASMPRPGLRETKRRTGCQRLQTKLPSMAKGSIPAVSAVWIKLGGKRLSASFKDNSVVAVAGSGRLSLSSSKASCTSAGKLDEKYLGGGMK